MSNMSYCRFQNTLKDLEDCFDNWDNADSKEEKIAKKRLLQLCRDIVDNEG